MGIFIKVLNNVRRDLAAMSSLKLFQALASHGVYKA
ncbi:hypothetical protein Lser_V15G40607 [Lactuca serriola]